MKLTIKEWFYDLFGFGYVVNGNSNEIHKLSNKHINCHHEWMTKKKYITKKSAFKKLEGLYDGCRFCWNEENKD